MPLFWSTDKIIADKYRLKTPIPVEYYPNHDDSDVYMFDKYIGSKIAENDDSDFIEELKRILQKEYHKNIYGQLYDVQKDDDFREKLLSYLEDITEQPWKIKQTVDFNGSVNNYHPLVKKCEICHGVYDGYKGKECPNIDTSPLHKIKEK